MVQTLPTVVLYVGSILWVWNWMPYKQKKLGDQNMPKQLKLNKITNIITGHTCYWDLGGDIVVWLNSRGWLPTGPSGRGQYFHALAKIKKSNSAGH